MKLLFVCLGNICRSPLAEAIAKSLIQKEGLNITCDSAGTSGLHKGEQADIRVRNEAQKKGYEVTSLSRPFEQKDFDNFNWIIVMDNFNFKDVLKLSRNKQDQKKILKMADFCKEHDIVADPYYGNKKDFEQLVEVLEEGCNNLLKKLSAKA